MARRLTARRCARAALAALFATLACAAATVAEAATYHVDPDAGVDDAARDATMPSQAWKTIAFAIEQANDGASHSILLLPGEYSEATGQTFPVELPSTLSLLGSGPDVTILRDVNPRGVPTIDWQAVAPETIDPGRQIRDLSILREVPDEPFTGIGVRVQAVDTLVAPVLTNLVVRGTQTGIDAVSSSVYTAAGNALVVDSSLLTANVFGLQAYAYTYSGMASRVDPTLRNSIVSGNFADGAIFETAANLLISIGQRRAAESAPVLTHCTLSDNVGSGVLLTNYNNGYAAGSVEAAIRNSILARNGDYSVLEDTPASDATTFTNNLLGGLQLALYLDEGIDPLMTIEQVEAAVDSPNFEGVPEYADDLGPTWRLRADSPGVDQGEPGLLPTDIDGDARPIDGDGDGTALPDIGADEAPACAVDVSVLPSEIPDQCGPGQSVMLDASASAPAAGFDCMSALEFTWYDGDTPFSTDSVVTVNPTESTTYTVVVRCPDVPNCQDSVELPVIVHPLPTAEANGPYEACVDAGAADAEIELMGLAQPPEGGFIESVEWTADTGIFIGAATTRPVLIVENNGENQVVTVTFTATDNRGCQHSDTATVSVWRGPVADAGGPYVACQDPDADETSIPITGMATPATGSTIVSWNWSADVGNVVDGNTPTPSLVLRNVPFTRQANVTLVATDEHGCTGEASALVTLHPSPSTNPGGPYQMQEDASATTSFALTGDASGGTAPLTLTWTTSLGTFQSTGMPTVTGTTTPTLDIVNTGADQTADVCFQAVDANDCGEPQCTVALVRTSPPQPPNPVGGTFRIRDLGTEARLSWSNPAPDATHDIATRFAVWQSETPGSGGWSRRSGLEAVPAGSGTTSANDAALVDPAGPDLLFLKVVSENDAGAACTDPELQLPDCN